MPATHGDSAVDAYADVQIAPRHFTLSDDVWFAPDLEGKLQHAIVALLGEGQMPEWPLVIPPELRISRKLAFHLDRRIVVIAGVGLVKKEHNHISVSTPIMHEHDLETTIMHDSFVQQLDLRRDPLGGLSKETLHLALRRMHLARDTAGSMAVIPTIEAHGLLHGTGHDVLGFLVYSYPAGVEKPTLWSADSEDFYRGMENMAMFLAALHRRLFHGSLYRTSPGWVNTLWATDATVLPVITGWGQHAGLISNDLAARDLEQLVEAGINQLHLQRIPQAHLLSLNMVRRVLRAYGRLQAAFKHHEFDYQCDPLAGWLQHFDDTIGRRALIAQYVAEHL
jgi:hypothetical protein